MELKKKHEPQGWAVAAQQERKRVGEQGSREHHWWPVAIQSYWSVLGKVSFMNPEGKIEAKVYRNEKIGRKAHGHTILHHDINFSLNFENEFREADDSIHNVLFRLIKIFSNGFVPRQLWSALKYRLRGKSDLSIFSNNFEMDHRLRRDLLNICLSLLIRSPANRYRLEGVGSTFGLPRDQDTGKVNMLNQVRAMKSAFNSGFPGNLFPLLIYSYRKEFFFGDGLLDSITGHMASQIRGHAIIPLTPHICVFLDCPNAIRSDRNSKLLLAPDWLVDDINEMTQVYSKEFIFFASQKPDLTDDFRRREHRSYKYNSNATVATLRNLCGEPTRRWFSDLKS